MTLRAAALAAIFAFQGLLCLPIWMDRAPDCHEAAASTPASPHPPACEFHCAELSHAVESSAPDASPAAVPQVAFAEVRPQPTPVAPPGADRVLLVVPPSADLRVLHSVFRL